MTHTSSEPGIGQGSWLGNQADPTGDSAVYDPAQPDNRNRSTSVEQVVLDAASQLLAEGGVRHLTIERVARRTGIAKTTIYRRWRSRDDLALAVVLRMTRTVVSSPDAGDDVDSLLALRNLVTGAVDILRSTPMGSIMRGLASELATDPHLSTAFREQVVALRRQRLADIVAVGIERGELRRDTDIDLLHDLLFGPIYYRLLTSEAPLDTVFATEIVDAVMPGLDPRVGQRPL
jgi:AcrR family transcriptional regulator